MKTSFAIIVLLSTISLAAEDLKPGLLGEYFEMESDVGDFPKLPPEKKPAIRRVDKQINVENCDKDFFNTNLDSNFYVRWTGTLKIDKAGKYKLFTESDDGSRLSVDGKPVVSNGGSHPMSKVAGEIELAAGPHQIVLEFFQGSGQMGCKFIWQPPGKNEELVPEGVLFHKPETE